MDLFVVGTSHAVAPVEVRERLHIELDEAFEVLEELVRGRGVLAEAVPVATCARLELYAVAQDAGWAEELVRRLVRRRAGLRADALDEHVYSYRGDAAVKHLLRVASGLDSVVYGEAQVLGQVRDAAHDPRGTRVRGPTLHRLFEAALATGKRVRTETQIGRGAASLASAALREIEGRMGSLVGARALVLGAGETGALVARLLRKAGLARLVIANRTEGSATSLATDLGAEGVGLEAIAGLLPEMDLVVGALGGEGGALGLEQVRGALSSEPGRNGAMLHFVDLGHPRNFDPRIGDLPGVDVLDLEQVFARVESARAERAAHVPRAEAIVAEQADRFLRWMRSRGSLDVLRAIREQALEVARAEADRIGQSQDEDERVRLRRLARSIARTLLHAPTLALRDADASTPSGRALIESAVALFGVEGPPDGRAWPR